MLWLLLSSSFFHLLEPAAAISSPSLSLSLPPSSSSSSFSSLRPVLTISSFRSSLDAPLSFTAFYSSLAPGASPLKFFGRAVTENSNLSLSAQVLTSIAPPSFESCGFSLSLSFSPCSEYIRDESLRARNEGAATQFETRLESIRLKETDQQEEKKLKSCSCSFFNTCSLAITIIISAQLSSAHEEYLHHSHSSSIFMKLLDTTSFNRHS